VPGSFKTFTFKLRLSGSQLQIPNLVHFMQQKPPKKNCFFFWAYLRTIKERTSAVRRTATNSSGTSELWNWNLICLLLLWRLRNVHKWTYKSQVSGTNINKKFSETRLQDCYCQAKLYSLRSFGLRRVATFGTMYLCE
jgi:hypothetical protein